MPDPLEAGLVEGVDRCGFAFPEEDACAECFAERCCDEATACAGEPTCQQVLTCVGRCACGDEQPSCRLDCAEGLGASGSDGAAALVAVTACSATECDPECGVCGGLGLTLNAQCNACIERTATACEPMKICAADASCAEAAVCAIACNDPACAGTCPQLEPDKAVMMGLAMRAVGDGCAAACGLGGA